MSNYNVSSMFFGGFSSTSSFSGLIGEYAQIRSGAYKKLLRAYYGQYNADGTTKSTQTTSSPIRKQKTSSDTADSAKSLTSVSEAATTLQNAAMKLAEVKEGSSSLYAKKTMVDKAEDGTTTTRYDYDYDGVVNAVKSFVSAYNDTLDKVGKVSSPAVQQKTKWMMDVAAQYKSQLSEFGIEMDDNGRLSLKEDVLRGRDMTDIQDFFEGSNSFVNKLARKASALAGSAELQATKAASAYTSTGKTYPADSMNSGSIFDSLF
ncbi:MAG: hypothetical protein J1E35_08920 [Lachnospiraceae bacterium]|nr:hypothetical protein [Lachnospiraceae bacterium]